MLTRSAQMICLSICVTALPSYASANDIPAELEQTAECMLNVLQTTPGVQDAKLLITDKNLFVQGSSWTHPNLEFSSLDKQGLRHTILFEASKSHPADRDIYLFTTVLPIGMQTPGVAGQLDDWGAGEIEKEWKSKCGVDALTITA
ncbi:MAG TPA: hypothetical protein VIJ62_13455 [Rhizomicrobium sp.]